MDARRDVIWMYLAQLRFVVGIKGLGTQLWDSVRKLTVVVVLALA
jgi:hypothetical protein